MKIDKNLSRDVFKCSSCNITCCTEFIKDAHERKCKPLTQNGGKEKWLKCGFCPKKFCTKQQLGEHELTHGNVHLFKCKVYHLSFKNVCSLRFHSNLYLDKKLKCEECGNEFHKSPNLKRHTECVHFKRRDFRCGTYGKTFTASPGVTPPEESRKYAAGGTFECQLCGKKNSRMPRLTEHMQKHTGNLLNCHLCGKGFATNHKVKEHIRVVHKTPK